MVCRSCPANPLHPGILLELLPNVRSSCFLMRSSYHRPICMSTDNMCIFYTSVHFTNLKCNICTVSRNHFLLLVTQKFQFYTIYAIFLIMWYIKYVFAIHIVLPMTYDYRAGLWECAARNNPQASRSGAFAPDIIVFRNSKTKAGE